LVEGGKDGTIYVIDRDQMTAGNEHYCSSCTSTAGDTQIVQELLPPTVGDMYSTSAYWNGMVYIWGSSDVLRSYSVNSSGQLVAGAVSSISKAFPGATPAISASGTTNGIVWAVDTSAVYTPGPSVLYAFQATNVATELYDSTQASGGRDTLGDAVKFVVPTIANGKVYVGTATEIDVFGKLP